MGIPHPAGYGKVGAVTHIQLFLGGMSIKTEQNTLAQEPTLTENLPAGTVLGKVTASGQLRAAAAANGDGSEVPYAVLQEDVDFNLLVAGTVPLPVVIKAEVNEDALVLGTGLTLDGIRSRMREIGLTLHKTY